VEGSLRMRQRRGRVGSVRGGKKGRLDFTDPLSSCF
jgi:hypothetical protein